MSKHRTLLFTLLITVFWCLDASARYSVEAVPNPRLQGNDQYVSDPDGHLSAGARELLNAIGAKIEAANGSEFAMVVVDDYQGASDFDFALDLFRHWGIGKQGSDNGLLLFLAMDRREYRFTSGYGVEGIFPDALLRQIGEQFLVPHLKSGDTDRALLVTAKAVESVFLSPEHRLELSDLQAYQPSFWSLHGRALEQSLLVIALFAVAFIWISQARRRVLRQRGIQAKSYAGHPFAYACFAFLLLLFLSLFVFAFVFDSLERVYRLGNLPGFIGVFCSLVLFFHFYGCRQFIKTRTKDRKTSLDMQVAFARWTLLPLLLAPLAYKAYYDLVRQSRDARRRAVPPSAPGTWVRLDRAAPKAEKLRSYLTAQQVREDRLGARSYEIWLDQATGQKRAIAFAGEHSRRYSTCPGCNGQTLQRPTVKVIKAATRSRSGIGERIQACAFCNYSKSFGQVTLAQLADESRSSSGGSSGGGSSGGSSGGGFGGGSSGGGGAGGRW